MKKFFLWAVPLTNFFCPLVLPRTTTCKSSTAVRLHRTNGLLSRIKYRNRGIWCGPCVSGVMRKEISRNAQSTTLDTISNPNPNPNPDPTPTHIGTAPIRRDILLKDGPKITAFTSSKVRPIKFEDCLRIGDGDWWGKRRDRAAVETCDLCRRELWRSRDRARPLVQLGCWGNRRRRGRPRTQCWWGGVSPLYYLASCVCLLEPAPSL